MEHVWIYEINVGTIFAYHLCHLSANATLDIMCCRFARFPHPVNVEQCAYRCTYKTSYKNVNWQKAKW